MPTAGSILLDAQGNRILDASGNIKLASGTPGCGCCGNCWWHFLVLWDCWLNPDGWRIPFATNDQAIISTSAPGPTSWEVHSEYPGYAQKWVNGDCSAPPDLSSDLPTFNLENICNCVCPPNNLPTLKIVDGPILRVTDSGTCTDAFLYSGSDVTDWDGTLTLTQPCTYRKTSGTAYDKWKGPANRGHLAANEIGSEPYRGYLPIIQGDGCSWIFRASVYAVSTHHCSFAYKNPMSSDGTGLYSLFPAAIGLSGAAATYFLNCVRPKTLLVQ